MGTAPSDARDILAPWLARREAEEAGAEDYLFPYESSRDALKQRLETKWSELATRKNWA